MLENERSWTIWADTGGTFTDIIAQHSPSNFSTKFKILSSSSIQGTVTEVSQDDGLIKFSSNLQLPNVEDFWKFCRLRLVSLSPGILRSNNLLKNTFEITGSINQSLKIKVENNSNLLNKSLSGGKIEILSPEAPPVLAARILTKIPHGSSLPPIAFNIATTKATNALLEKKTPPVTLFINKGLEDLLSIGSQQRTDLFSLSPKHTSFIPQNVIPISARLTPNGDEIDTLNEKEITGHTDSWKNTQAAICLLHSTKNPQHEKKLKRILRRLGIKVGGISSELSPFIKIIDRAETVVVNAALEPVLGNYINLIKNSGHGHSVRIMTSAGSMTRVEGFNAKDSLLSGPAGGVVGIGWVSRKMGREKTIGLDMGGTSTDVSRNENGPVLRYQHKVGHAKIMGPSVEIETVAAGGGSICSFEDGLLRVGPESAGSSPGPACYGLGGPLTLTDVNLLAGRMRAENFGIPISRQASELRLEEVFEKILKSEGFNSMTRDQLITGFIDIANEHMAEAIRKISVREGYDPRQYSLIAFGGAGGQHGCEVADKLGIKEVIGPTDGGILSARGLNQAREKSMKATQIMAPLTRDTLFEVADLIKTLETRAISDLKNQGVCENILIEARIAEVRVLGHEYCETIFFKAPEEIRDNFMIQFKKVFGYLPLRNASLELVNLRVIAATAHKECSLEIFPEFKKEKAEGQLRPKEQEKLLYLERGDLISASLPDAPTVVQDKNSTVFKPKSWFGVVGNEGTILLKKIESEKSTDTQPNSHSDLVETEIYANRFSSIAEQMGEVLKRTAISTNVKERLDFSCAVLDSKGFLVANAPHIPVHLGALGSAVRSIIATMQLEPGDMIVTNHPGYGGSHLPDITLIQPIFDQEKECIGFLANRAHHAEIGGLRAGSMPPNAKCLAEEGVVIKPTYLFRKGQSHIENIRRILTTAPYPTRQIEENIADLMAQAAANFKGEALIKELIKARGSNEVKWIMQRICKQATHCFAAKLQSMNGFANSAKHKLDDGHEIHLNLEISNSRLRLDFTGTSSVHSGNLNANPGIVRSVILYGIRLWIEKPIPLNDGLLDLVDLVIPDSFLNPHFPDNPFECPAVVGGNTETSQMVFETFAKATGILAGSQGTMNNFIFGNEKYSFYETIGGGSGAGDGFHGSDAIHSHMTNTAITDPEILESKYPVRLLKSSIRKHSGGKGKYRGGHGIHREIMFLEAMQINIISHQRMIGPIGINGGENGCPGEQYILRPTKVGEEKHKRIQLNHIDQFDALEGDILVIKTPGGGGFGSDKSI